MLDLDRHTWMDAAACHDTDPHIFFAPEGAGRDAYNQALLFCNRSSSATAAPYGTPASDTPSTTTSATACEEVGGVRVERKECSLPD